MMKKITALLLVFLLLTGGIAAAEAGDGTWSFTRTGITVSVPDRLAQTQGMLYTQDLGLIDLARKISASTVMYLAATAEEKEMIAQLNNGAEASQDQIDRINEIFGSAIPLYDFISVGNDQSYEDVRDILLGDDVPKDIYVPHELGRTGEYRFFLLQPNPESEALQSVISLLPESLREEYMSLLQDAEELKSGISLQEPANQAGEGETADNHFYFAVNDLTGNPVTSTELFAGHPVTLINLWTSWCGPCINELGELEKIWKDYSSKGAGLIGICLDASDPQTVSEALNIAKFKGVTYPMLACTQELEYGLFSFVSVYPTTIFVNEKGEVIAGPIIGTQPEAYRETLDALLK